MALELGKQMGFEDVTRDSSARRSREIQRAQCFSGAEKTRPVLGWVSKTR